MSHIIYSKYILFCVSFNLKRSLSSKLLVCGSVVYNCLSKFVCDRFFLLDFVVNFYTISFFFKVVTGKLSHCLNLLLPPKSHTYATRSRFTHTRSSNRISALTISVVLPKALDQLPHVVYNSLNDPPLQLRAILADYVLEQMSV